jgi:hypothetical protein
VTVRAVKTMGFIGAVRARAGIVGALEAAGTVGVTETVEAFGIVRFHTPGATVVADSETDAKVAASETVDIATAEAAKAKTDATTIASFPRLLQTAPSLLQTEPSLLQIGPGMIHIEFSLLGT